MKLFIGLLLSVILFSGCELKNDTAEDIKTSMLEEVNKLRLSGCDCSGDNMPSVHDYEWNDQLEAAAIRHAKDMSDNSHFDHKGTDGSNFGERIKDAGYQYSAAAENIAHGSSTVDAVMNQWINSQGHCKNMMSEKYTKFAAAKVGRYWVQVFAK